MNGKPLHILFAGGGTGGHLFPALAIAEAVTRLRPGTQVSFAGTADRIEARVVPPLGYGFTAIWISGVQRRLSLRTLLVPVKVAVSLVQSFRLLRRSRPQTVVGTGGYVCGPVVYTASLMKIPTVIQEQNSVPGVTTRLLAPRARRVYLTFEETRKRLPPLRGEVVVSGNPTRGAVGRADRKEAQRFFDVVPGRPVLLVFGGSLGARSINTAVADMMNDLAAANVQVIWQTGAEDFERLRRSMTGDGTIRMFPFIDRMDLAYAAADLVLCRAGATTLAELTCAGVPAILVPYPFAAADHQTSNAEALAAAGAALVIRDADLPERLRTVLPELLADDHRRRDMRARARALGRPEAAETIARGVIELAEQYDAQ